MLEESVDPDMQPDINEIHYILLLITTYYLDIKWLFIMK